MSDLTDPRLMWLKAILFVVCGTMAAFLLLLDQPTLRATMLLGLVIWCFCRAYYFAFHVVANYIDGAYRYAGLLSLLRDAVRSRRDRDKIPTVGRKRQSLAGGRANQ